ncbi:MAG: hypothetical protein E5X78_17570 [Mesorhizobium sp.]|nr:MAG: hypothetical protein E5X78_17570 [Mesorhizobium sp.]
MMNKFSLAETIFTSLPQLKLGTSRDRQKPRQFKIILKLYSPGCVPRLDILSILQGRRGNAGVA